MDSKAAPPDSLCEYDRILDHKFLLCLDSHICERVVEMSDSDPGFLAAFQEAKNGFAEGGVPIGACLVSKEGKILGQGHNMRVQKGSATLHVWPCIDCRFPSTHPCVG